MNAGTGRIKARTPSRGVYCPNCRQRMVLGEPKPTEVWVHRLRFTEDEWADLMGAAASFSKLCEEANEVETAPDFVDWIRVDVLGLHSHGLGEYDGVKTKESLSADPVPFGGRMPNPAGWE